MKITRVNDRDYRCPLYVVRVENGWQVRLPHFPTSFFGDNAHGSVGKSHKAACEARAQSIPIGQETRPLAEKERANKKNPLGVPGVFLIEKFRANKRLSEFQLQVRVRPFPAKTMYVGTSENYKPRLAEKLILAAKVREEYIELLAAGKAPKKAKKAKAKK